MTLKHQKIISAGLIAFVAYGGLYILAYIVNLNQPVIFLKAALLIYLYLSFKITLLYDLHFKNPGALERAQVRHESVPHWLSRGLKILGSAFVDRISHLLRGHQLLRFQNFLILPGLLFWPTAIFLYVNMGSTKIQAAMVFLSGTALVVTYWYLKEAMVRGSAKVGEDIFVSLSAIKIYAAALSFGGTMAIMHRFCVEPRFFVAAVFCLTFLLIYQALFQDGRLSAKNTAWTVLISAIQAVAGYFVYLKWGYNYYTAAIFMAAIYNLMWGTLHYHLGNALTKRAFLEILFVCAIITLMVFSVTNFKAELLHACTF
jgi:hypothetical protein